MQRYLLDSEQLMIVLERTIDLFQEYQYKRGFEEPRARAEAILDMVSTLIPLVDLDAVSGT